MKESQGLFITDCIRNRAGVVTRWPAPPGSPSTYIISALQVPHPRRLLSPGKWLVTLSGPLTPGSPCSPLARSQRPSFPVHPTCPALHLLPDDLIHQRLSSHSGLVACSVLPLRHVTCPYRPQPPSRPSLLQCSGCSHGSHQLKSEEA